MTPWVEIAVAGIAVWLIGLTFVVALLKVASRSDVRRAAAFEKEHGGQGKGSSTERP